MLNKLLKYDFKATSKYFLPMSIFVLLYSCLGTILFRINGNVKFSGNGLINILTVLAIVAFFIMIIGYMIVTQGIIVVNFYKNMVTDTGYLTHTLPVSKLSLLLSKLISGTALVLFSYIVSGVSTLIMFHVPGFLMKYKPSISELYKLTDGKSLFPSLLSIILSFSFAIVAGTIYSLCMYFMCIALGQLLNRHKIIGSFVAYFVIQFITQIISTILTFLGSGTLNILDESIILNSMSGIIAGISVFALILSAGMFTITHYIFTHKLNLD